MCQSLSELCLGTITNDFDRYNLAFTTTQDPYLKRYLEFLQRKYSFELISHLSAKEVSLENYVDFLINKYLKFLDTSWLRNCSWEKVTSLIAEIGPNIEKICFQDVYFDEFCEVPPWQDLICYLPNLKSLEYQDDCHDLIIKNVVKFCPNIEEINLENSEVTFEAMKDLCANESGEAHCTRLKKIWISGLNIAEEDVKYFLKNLPSLEMIDSDFDIPLVLYSLHEADLSTLDKISYNINTLNVNTLVPIYNNVLKVCLSVCPHLKDLTVAVVNADELKMVSNLSDLEILNIQNLSESEININSLLKSRGRKLTSLTVMSFSVSVSVIAESCPRLRELNLDRVNLLYDDDSKPVFNSLSSCSFKYTNVSENATAINLLLSSTKRLESLCFQNCNLLSAEIKTPILKCSELHPLKKMSFSSSQIEKEYVKELLLKCRTLNYLDVLDCFDVEDQQELLKFAEILCNKPEIDTSYLLYLSDSDEYLNGNYEDYDLEDCYDFSDYDGEDYDDYEYGYDSDEDSDI